MRQTAHKAVTAAVLALAGALGAALLDGNLTVPELLAALGAGLVAGGGTYQVENKPRP